MKPGHLIALLLFTATAHAAESQNAPIAYRGNKLDAGAVKLLPTPGAFEQKFFPSNPSGQGTAAIANACLALADGITAIPGFLDGHGGLSSLVSDLKAFTTQLQQGRAATPEKQLLPSFSTKVASVSISARNIAARSNEYPEAIAVAKQIEALAEIIRKRLPPLP